MKHELGINDGNKNIMVDLYHLLREFCEEYLEDNPLELGGFHEDGTPIVVEIDESKHFHRTYHRGQWRDGHWVFGAIKCYTGRCCMVEVPNCRKQTLVPIIERWILPGSRIISDAWAAYAEIDKIRGGIYAHVVVVHQEMFLAPGDGTVHPQNIKITRYRAKRKLRRQCRTSSALFPSYVSEVLWRNRWEKPQYFAALINTITVFHPV